MKAKITNLVQVLLIALGLIVSVPALAFVGPPGSPTAPCPSGTTGCDAPINAGPTGQSKSGGLRLGGSGTPTTGYMLDVLGQMWSQGIVNSGAIRTSGGISVGSTTALPNYKITLGSDAALSIPTFTKLAVWDDGSGGTFGLGANAGQFVFHVNASTDKFSFFNGPGTMSSGIGVGAGFALGPLALGVGGGGSGSGTMGGSSGYTGTFVSPAEVFTVHGTGQLTIPFGCTTTSPCTGKVLTSDALGNATWAGAGAGTSGVLPWHMSGSDAAPVAQLGTSAATISGDAGGSIELGGTNGMIGTGTPYIDFHSPGAGTGDYNMRIINNANGVLDVEGGDLKVNGQSVCRQDGTNCPGSSGSAGMYVMNPHCYADANMQYNGQVVTMRDWCQEAGYDSGHAPHKKTWWNSNTNNDWSTALFRGDETNDMTGDCLATFATSGLTTHCGYTPVPLGHLLP